MQCGRKKTPIKGCLHLTGMQLGSSYEKLRFLLDKEDFFGGAFVKGMPWTKNSFIN